jgi:DNA repair ATPase RecN
MSNSADLIEKSPLWKLKDSLSDAQSSTKKMLSKLEKFERRLGNLDSKISRIQTTTENYSRARENITLVLSEVQKTNEYFRVAKEVEPAMKAKFANPKALFLGIERLTNAKIFFNAHEKGIKASGQALKTLDGLIKVRRLYRSE